MYPTLKEHIHQILKEEISESRKPVLQELVEYISLKRKKGEQINLNFICTHNSRRSHLSQIWAQTAAAFYNIKEVYSYSGGTEATAMFKTIRETLIIQGFNFTLVHDGTNPLYAIKTDEAGSPIWAFSKKYDHPVNPQSNYAAVMTCSHADENCPIVYGAEKRIPITYLDPKAYDNSPLQIEKYMEKSREIAAEMLYVFGKVV